MSKQPYVHVRSELYPSYPPIVNSMGCTRLHGIIGVTAFFNKERILKLVATCSDGSKTKFFGDESIPEESSRKATCPTGTVVVGMKTLYAKQSNSFESFSVICGSSNSKYAVEKDSSTNMKVFGVAPTMQLRCPDKYFCNGISGVTSTSINSLGLTCADYRYGVTANSVPAQVGSPSKNSTLHMCAYGHFMKGISGNARTNLNGLKGTCYGETHTTTLGQPSGSFGNFVTSCPVGQGIVGLKLNVTNSYAITGLAVICEPPPQTWWPAPSPSPVSAPPEPRSPEDIIIKAQKVAEEEINAGFVGVVRVGASKATCSLKTPINLDFDMLETLSESLALEQPIVNSSKFETPIETPSQNSLRRYCGSLPVSASSDGCVWQTATLLGVLYEQGLFCAFSTSNTSNALECILSTPLCLKC